MRSFLLLSFLLLALANVTAQSDFRPGFVITNSLDTIQGFLDNRGEIRNMTVCNFKESPDSDSKEFFPGDIHGYRFNSGKFFVTKMIDTEELKDTVFVEFLLKGISNLYFYKNADYSAYFLETEQDKLLELRKMEIEYERDGRLYSTTDNKYVGVLKYALSDVLVISKDINKTAFNHKSMIDITRQYHDYKCTDEACVIYEKKIPAIKVEVKPLIGWSVSGIAFRSQQMKPANFETSSSPFGGLALNFMMPRWNEKLSFQLSVTFNKDQYNGSYRHETYNYNNFYHVETSNLASSLAFKYTYPERLFRPEFFVGLFANSMLKREASLVQERYIGVNPYLNEYALDYLLTKSIYGLTGGIGLEYGIFKKVRGFSNVSILYGASFQFEKIYMDFTSYRFSTGFIF